MGYDVIVDLQLNKIDWLICCLVVTQ